MNLHRAPASLYVLPILLATSASAAAANGAWSAWSESSAITAPEPRVGTESALEEFVARDAVPAASPGSSAFTGTVGTRLSDPADPAADSALFTTRSIPTEDDDKYAAARAAGVPIHPALTDKFFFGVGVYAARTNSEARLDSSAGIGAVVDFESTLGLKDADYVPEGLARWRMSERWRLELEHFAIDRTGDKTIQTEVDWGDNTFHAGDTLHTKFDVSVTRVSVGYSFFKRPDKEVGIALGFHLTDIHAAVGTEGGSSEGGAALAPLPVISLYGQFALTDKWAINSRFDAFRLAYNPYEGNVFSTGLDVIYQAWRHVAFGLGYRSLQFDFGAHNDRWHGSVDSSYQGGILFVATSF